MQIEILSNQTIKVILDKYDLKEFDIIYNQINQNSVKTQLLFFDILERVHEESGMDFSEKDIYFELFPTKNSGCLVYISVDYESDEDENNSELIYIYKFDNINSIIESSQETQELCKIFKCKSELYFGKSGFFLLLTIYRRYENFIKSMIIKLGTPFSSGNINAEYIREHFECIGTENIIEKMSNLTKLKS